MSTNRSSDSRTDSIINSEGSLANKLHSAFEFTCKKFISSIKFSLFKSKYKEIYEKNPEELKNIYDQLCSQITKTITEELDEIHKDLSIDFQLNSLDVIMTKQDPSQQSWRPSGNPEEDLRDHIFPLKMIHKGALQEMLKKLCDRNEELIINAGINHSKILDIKKTNEDLYEEFSNVITAVTGHNIQSIEGTLVNKVKKI